MSQELSLKEIQKEWHGSLKSYAIGFTASLLLTLTSFFLVYARYFAEKELGYMVFILALTQGIFQLRFFLHLGEEGKPKWESHLFYFMGLVILIIALGSLWIMYDLNERLMPGM